MDIPTITKADLIDRRLRDRRDMGLQEWVSVRRSQTPPMSWRQIERELWEAVGWDERPMTRVGLSNWWNRQEAKP